MAPGCCSIRVAYTLLWAVGIIVICAPLAVMQYQRSIKSW